MLDMGCPYNLQQKKAQMLNFSLQRADRQTVNNNGRFGQLIFTEICLENGERGTQVFVVSVELIRVVQSAPVL